MSSEEPRRLSIINKAIDKLITHKKSAELIGLSYRQTKRLIKRVKKEGDKGIIHRLRGKRGNRKIDDKIKAKVIDLYNQKYLNFGLTLASEKLYELDKIRIDHDILRRWNVIRALITEINDGMSGNLKNPKGGDNGNIEFMYS